MRVILNVQLYIYLLYIYILYQLFQPHWMHLLQEKCFYEKVQKKHNYKLGYNLENYNRKTFYTQDKIR